ncbi:hypothetical protein PR048_002673 [Dryococelus australis]|uniref:Uncharacterized protein n=1 Tax=Dryococelus australis TaxID=614101 RepID=A0ABQ9IKZ1_9NEOP|nr:hypothetical protein PR048_002673 [Dryococelus australis]
MAAIGEEWQNRFRLDVIQDGRHGTAAPRHDARVSEEICKALNIEVLRADAGELSMEQHRYEWAGEMGDPRENPPTNGIVRHDFHMRKSGVTRPGIEPGSPWREASRQRGFCHHSTIISARSLARAWSTVQLMTNRDATRRKELGEQSAVLVLTQKTTRFIVPLDPIGRITASETKERLGSCIRASYVHNSFNQAAILRHAVQKFGKRSRAKLIRLGTSSYGSEPVLRQDIAVDEQPSIEDVAMKIERMSEEICAALNSEVLRADEAEASGIVRHDSHMRKSGSDPARNRARFAFVGEISYAFFHIRKADKVTASVGIQNTRLETPARISSLIEQVSKKTMRERREGDEGKFDLLFRSPRLMFVPAAPTAASALLPSLKSTRRDLTRGEEATDLATARSLSPPPPPSDRKLENGPVTITELSHEMAASCHNHRARSVEATRRRKALASFYRLFTVKCTLLKRLSPRPNPQALTINKYILLQYQALNFEGADSARRLFAHERSHVPIMATIWVLSVPFFRLPAVRKVLLCARQHHDNLSTFESTDYDLMSSNIAYPSAIRTINIALGLESGAAVAQWLGRSPPATAIRARYPAGSFPRVGIVLDDAACRRVFSEYSRFPRPCIPAPLHPRVSVNVMSRDDGHLRVPAGKSVTRNVIPGDENKGHISEIARANSKNPTHDLQGDRFLGHQIEWPVRMRKREEGGQGEEERKVISYCFIYKYAIKTLRWNGSLPKSTLEEARYETEDDLTRRRQGHDNTVVPLTAGGGTRISQRSDLAISQYSAELKWRGKREIPEKKSNHRPAASSGTIPTCENPGATHTGIEPGSPWWETSRLTAQPPRLPKPSKKSPRQGFRKAGCSDECTYNDEDVSRRFDGTCVALRPVVKRKRTMMFTSCDKHVRHKYSVLQQRSRSGEAIRATLTRTPRASTLLRARQPMEVKRGWLWSGAGMHGRGKRETLEKNHRPSASSGTIPKCGSDSPP